MIVMILYIVFVLYFYFANINISLPYIASTVPFYMVLLFSFGVYFISYTINIILKKLFFRVKFFFIENQDSVLKKLSEKFIASNITNSNFLKLHEQKILDNIINSDINKKITVYKKLNNAIKDQNYSDILKFAFQIYRTKHPSLDTKYIYLIALIQNDEFKKALNIILSIKPKSTSFLKLKSLILYKLWQTTHNQTYLKQSFKFQQMFLPAICDSYFLKKSYLSLKLRTIKNIWKHKPAFFECKNYIDSIEIKNYKALKNKLKIITNEYQNGIIATMLLLYIAIIKQQKPDFELNIDKKSEFYDPAIAIYKSLVSSNFITAIKTFEKIETIIKNKKFTCTNCKQNHIQYEIICKKCNHMDKIEINTFENEKANLKLKGE